MTIYSIIPRIYTRTAIINQFPERGRLLDVGCGSGDLLRIIKELRPDLEIYGTDIIKSEQLPNYVHFFKSDLNKKIRYKSSQFDVIISTHVLEHLEKHEVCVKEMSRVAKKGALLYIEVPSTRSVLLPSFSSIGNSQDVPINFYDDYSHLRPYTRRSLYSLATHFDFSIIKTGYVRHLGGLLFSPLFFIGAVLMGKRIFLLHAIWNVVGWACYCYAKKD